MTMVDEAISALQNGAKGAAMGAAIGPIGAAAGGLLGVAFNALPGLQHLLADNAGTIEKVQGTVAAVTGTSDPAQAQAALDADPDGIREDLQRQLAEIANDRLKATLADVANARGRDIQVRTMTGGKNARSDVMLAIAVIGIVACLSVAIIGKIDGNSAIFGLIAGLVGMWSGCFKDAFQFEFGSSRGSQNKDGTIADLAMSTVPASALAKPLTSDPK